MPEVKTTSFESARPPMNYSQKILQSPYALALLIGMYPTLFYISNNWFMLKASYTLLIFGSFLLIIFVGLSTYYLVLSWFLRKFFMKSSETIIQRLFFLASFVVLIYLLRHTFLEMVNNEYSALLTIGGVIALILTWFIPKIKYFRVNIILTIMCLSCIGSGLYSLATLEFNKLNSILGYEFNRGQYEPVTFSKRPNIYYIVPDGYPNREALKKIFNIDGTNFYHELETLGFTLYHQAFSNYRSTTTSISSMLGMGHHYYQGRTGNREMVDVRNFIVSNQNPVVHIFKNNGYQVHFVHDKDYLLTGGCLIDFCYPSTFWSEFINILLPSRVQKIPFIAKAIGRSSRDSQEKITSHISKISALPENYFTYMHLDIPSHAPPYQQTEEALAPFRKNYVHKIQVANERVTKIVDQILNHDPNALIILNADHGAQGLGAYRRGHMELFEGVTDDLIALDHLGALLAIRWPDKNVPDYQLDIRTNANLFRHIFAYLSESPDILSTKVTDDGFLTRGEGKGSIVFQVVHDGEILEDFVEMGQLKK